MESNKKSLDEQAAQQAALIPVIEEQLKVGKQVVESGKVIISKKVHQQQQRVDVALTHEEVNVERVAINQYVETPPAVRYEEDIMIIAVLCEEVVIEKRLILIEELHVTKKQVQTQASQQVTLQKEEVNVERIAGEDRGSHSIVD